MGAARGRQPACGGVMPGWAVAVAIAGAALVAALAVAVVRRQRPPVATAVIVSSPDSTALDDVGAVRSVQTAELTLPAAALDAIWSPMHLERLARTYWRFLTRCTLGLIRVSYTPAERFVVLLTRPFVLLRFRAPEYEMDADRGIVRWRIERGLLVSRRGRGGNGYLQIDVRRRDADEPGMAVVHVEVEVANFYPSIAAGIGTRFYRATQSRVHVLVTHGFLRSLARLDLAESRVGRLMQPEAAAPGDVPDPPGTPRE